MIIRPVTRSYSSTVEFKVRCKVTHLLINSIQPFGVHGKNPDMSPIAARPSLMVFSL